MRLIINILIIDPVKTHDLRLIINILIIDPVYVEYTLFMNNKIRCPYVFILLNNFIRLLFPFY